MRRCGFATPHINIGEEGGATVWKMKPVGGGLAEKNSIRVNSV